MGESQRALSTAVPDSSAPMDPGAFAVQFREVYTRLWQVAVGMIGDPTHAEDLVQESAVIALSKLDTFTPGSNFAAWMAAIVRGSALNYSRKIRRRGTIATDPTILDRSESAKSGSPRHHVVSVAGRLQADQTAFDDRLYRALLTLSETARCCLLLRVVEQLSYAEISALLQISEGTAMSHVHRSKATLRRYMRDQEATSTEKGPES